MNSDENSFTPTEGPPQEKPPSALRHFRLPLRVTGMALALGLAVGLGGAFWIHRTAESNYEKTDRVKLLGQGVGFGFCLVIFPFWMYACGKVGEKRRAARLAASRKKNSPEE
jgi:hypothetical protein